LQIGRKGEQETGRKGEGERKEEEREEGAEGENDEEREKGSPSVFPSLLSPSSLLTLLTLKISTMHR